VKNRIYYEVNKKEKVVKEVVKKKLIEIKKNEIKPAKMAEKIDFCRG